MQRTKGAILRRPLAVVVVAAGFALAGCANPTNAPGASSTAPSPPVMSSMPPAQPQAAAVTWATSMCQALRPAWASSARHLSLTSTTWPQRGRLTSTI